MQVISSGAGSCGRSGRGVRPRQALSPLLHCRNRACSSTPRLSNSWPCFPFSQAPDSPGSLFRPGPYLCPFSLLTLHLTPSHPSRNMRLSLSSLTEQLRPSCSSALSCPHAGCPIGELTHSPDISCLPVSLQPDCVSP